MSTARPADRLTVRLLSPLRLALLSLALAATASAQPVVVVTNSILRDIVTHVTGTEVEVRVLVPNEANTFEYEPTEADREKFEGAVALISNGAGLEPWLDDFVDKSRWIGSRIVASEDTALLNMEGKPYVENAPGEPAEPDPYTWHDPRIVVIYVENIRAALSTLMPTKAVIFRDNANGFKGQLESAYDYAVRELGRVPPANRHMVTSFDCFNYFGRAFGFRISRVPGITPGPVLRPAVLDRLIAIINPLRPKAVFLERGGNQTSLRDLSGALGVKVDTSLYGRNLGPERTPQADYLGMFRSNVDAIVAALGTPAANAKAPEPAKK